jgi:hypothetical protein
MHNKGSVLEAVIYDGSPGDADRLTINRQNISRLAGEAATAPGYLAL